MNIIQQCTRFLSGLGEIVNILAVAPIAAFAYSGTLDQLMAQGFTDGLLPPEQDPATYISICVAVIMVGFINGGFAVLFNIRNLIDDRHPQGQFLAQPQLTASMHDNVMPDTETPPGKTETKPKKQKQPKRKTKQSAKAGSKKR